ncbi:terminase small subunit [Arsukibacterium indicum]|uniref:Terminase small subunit n=1 Tax=Arsukibacterium indicum TaxID=2848612 RepID=A0ABS6MHA3_9GAMM|nr:terminase small subunit [Arsukibacterium indicum]MBV2128168.1 terminase small subunit [Arsukibacterium indicum]
MAELKPYDNWTDKEKLFVHEYLVDQNKTAAAIRAGYSAKSAKDQGCKLSQKPHIKAWIDERIVDKCEELDITVERVLKEVAKMAFMDPRKFFNADGSLKDITQLDDDSAACLGGLDITTRTDENGIDHKLTKVKLTSKKDNLELLGKHLKMWTDKVEVSEVPLVEIDRTGKKTRDDE